MSLLGSIFSPISSAVGAITSPLKSGFDWLKDKILGGTIGDYVDAYTGKSQVDAQKEYNSFQKQIAEENNMQNYKMWQEQREDNRRYFDDTMAFNSADSQVNRFREAGLNPALAMYQGVNAGTVSASSSPAPPVRQSPNIQPVDYSPMASAITNSISLLSQIGPMVEGLLGLSDASKRAKATTNERVGSGKVSKAAGNVAERTQKAAERTANAGAKIAETNAAILDNQLVSSTYQATFDQFRLNALGRLGEEKGSELSQLFNDSFMAELEQKVANKKLTVQQTAKVLEDTLYQQAENKKQQLGKEGYKEINDIIDSLDNGFFKTLARIFMTWMVDYR